MIDNYVSPLKFNIISDSFFGQGRLEIAIDSSKQKTLTVKNSIRFHNVITTFFLRLFGKIYDVRDFNGEVYHLNRGSLIKFLKSAEPTLETKELSNETIDHILKEFGKKNSNYLVFAVSEQRNQIINSENNIKRLIQFDADKNLQTLSLYNYSTEKTTILTKC